jgi:hypothetical protein
MRWSGPVALVGDRRGVYKVLFGKPERKRPFGRPRRRWEGHLKTNLKKVGWGTWTELSWLRIGTGGGCL